MIMFNKHSGKTSRNMFKLLLGKCFLTPLMPELVKLLDRYLPKQNGHKL